MLNTKSFSDILRDASPEYANEPAGANPSADWLNNGWESVLDPQGYSQILAQTEQYFFKPAYAYKRPASRLPPVPHSMNEEQTSAFQRLLAWAPELVGWFNQAQLKSAYRTSMLKTHPDRGGNLEIFQEARKCYEILLPLAK